MSLVLRTLVTWLLVLALPMQGAGAATRAFCGDGHHGGSASMSMQLAASAVHAHHAAPDATHEAHDQGAVEADNDGSDGSPDPTASAAAGHDNTHKCSACASCCAPGALLTPVWTVPVPACSGTVFSAGAPSVDEFAAAGLERPPRPVFA